VCLESCSMLNIPALPSGSLTYRYTEVLIYWADALDSGGLVDDISLIGEVSK